MCARAVLSLLMGQWSATAEGAGRWGGAWSAMAEGAGEVLAVSASGAANGLSDGAGATSAQTNNPLSRKLHKILETRLDNDKVAGGGRAGRPRELGGPEVRGRCVSSGLTGSVALLLLHGETLPAGGLLLSL